MFWAFRSYHMISEVSQLSWNLKEFRRKLKFESTKTSCACVYHPGTTDGKQLLTKSADATHQLTLELIFTLQLTVKILQLVFQLLSLLT